MSSKCNLCNIKITNFPIKSGNIKKGLAFLNGGGTNIVASDKVSDTYVILCLVVILNAELMK